MSENLILFDPFETLGSEIASEDKRLTDFDVYPSAQQLLPALRKRAQLGVLVFDPEVPLDTLRKRLRFKKLIPPIIPELIAVAGEGEANPFARLLREAGLAAERAVFVSLDAAHRVLAHAAGLRVAPHPALAEAALDGEELLLVRLFARAETTPAQWTSRLEREAVVPVLWEAEHRYAIASRSAVASLERSGVIGVEALGRPGLVERSTLYLFQALPEPQGDTPELSGYLGHLDASGCFPIPFQKPASWLFHLPGDRPLEEVRPPASLAVHGHTRVLLPDTSLLGPTARAVFAALRPLQAKEKKRLRKLDAKAFKSEFESWYLERGAVAKKESRHIYHTGNKNAVKRLLKRMREMGLSPKRHPFAYDGHFANVWAEIKGRKRKELIVIGAHLDSIANKDDAYDPSTSPAPGANDDASGVTAVLAVARVLKDLARDKRPERSIRFVLFNAEEQGKVGSARYAHYLKGTPRVSVAEMFAMEMLGGLTGARRKFEIHGVGGERPELKLQCDELVTRFENAARQVTRLKPEVYPRPGQKNDPASSLSDHASFLGKGWPACLLCQDAFAGPTRLRVDRAYHSASDLPGRLSFRYAAEIARTVAAAAWIDANS